MNITQQYIPKPSQRRSGIAIKGVKFIVAHDTGNDGSTAANNASYYTTSKDTMQASAHAFVDDKGVIEVIPATEKAWHVRYSTTVDNTIYGLDANDYSLGIELCYSTKGTIDNELAYWNYVTYIADLCKKYGINPRTNIIAHKTLDPDRRTDPINAFSKTGKTWDKFIDNVSAFVKPETMPVVNSLERAQMLLSEAMEVIRKFKDGY